MSSISLKTQGSSRTIQSPSSSSGLTSSESLPYSEELLTPQTKHSSDSSQLFLCQQTGCFGCLAKYLHCPFNPSSLQGCMLFWLQCLLCGAAAARNWEIMNTHGDGSDCRDPLDNIKSFTLLQTLLKLTLCVSFVGVFLAKPTLVSCGKNESIFVLLPPSLQKAGLKNKIKKKALITWLQSNFIISSYCLLLNC